MPPIKCVHGLQKFEGYGVRVVDFLTFWAILSRLGGHLFTFYASQLQMIVFNKPTICEFFCCQLNLALWLKSNLNRKLDFVCFLVKSLVLFMKHRAERHGSLQTCFACFIVIAIIIIHDEAKVCYPVNIFSFHIIVWHMANLSLDKIWRWIVLCQ